MILAGFIAGRSRRVWVKTCTPCGSVILQPTHLRPRRTTWLRPPPKSMRMPWVSHGRAVTPARLECRRIGVAGPGNPPSCTSVVGVRRRAQHAHPRVAQGMSPKRQHHHQGRRVLALEAQPTAQLPGPGIAKLGSLPAQAPRRPGAMLPRWNQWGTAVHGNCRGSRLGLWGFESDYGILGLWGSNGFGSTLVIWI